jgi:ABC-type tungstate transport system permease subunit
MPPRLAAGAVVLGTGLLSNGTTASEESTGMLDKLTPSAEETARETAEEWLSAFGAALAHGEERALAELFVPDSHWRNLFGANAAEARA